jgi:NTE family protein
MEKNNETNLASSPFALALSGGGYRATLFHLGALRRLNEVGLLKRTTRIVSVSGGSLLLGFLASRIPEVFDKDSKVKPEDWAEKVSKPVHAFVTEDLRTSQIIRNILLFSVFGRKRRLNKAISHLKKIYGNARLSDIKFDPKDSKFPELYILSTDCIFGQAFRFSNNPKKSGHSKIGWADLTETSFAEACMVSACFPPLFGPYFPDLKKEQFSGGSASASDIEKIPDIALADGGLYDNIGVNLVSGSSSKFIRLYSDAGSPLSYNDKKWTKTPFVTLRYMQLMSNFVGLLNIQRIKASTENKFAFWSSKYEVKELEPDEIGYSNDIIENVLEDVRTDLNKFSSFEAKVLENFGYTQTELALKRYFGEEYLDLSSPKAVWPYPEETYTDNDHIRSNFKV